MTRVKIFGAGSIGNHLAQASRRAGWDVVVVDPNVPALERMKEEIYPTRYGAWDDAIQLCVPGAAPFGGFDAIFVGTPPDVRMSVALAALEEKPRVMLLEKPAFPPNLGPIPAFLSKVRKSGTAVCVGYDHAVASSVQFAANLFKSGKFGAPETMDAEFRVHWGDIFAAHPWLKGPDDTYLGFSHRGGGASGEHSHAIHLWQYFSHVLGQSRVHEVSAVMDYVAEPDGAYKYDRACFVTVKTESGFVGRIVQDVVTKPHRQTVRIQCADGFVEWHARWNAGGDLVRWSYADNASEQLFSKSRPDDFYAEILHIQELLDGKVSAGDSPLSLERGLDALLVVAAAHKSSRERRTVLLDYGRNYGPDSLQ